MPLSRCVDPTELGTFNSGILCRLPECPGSLWSVYKNICLTSEKYFVLPSPHRALVWRCTSCGDTQPLDLVLKLVRDAETFIRNNVGSTVDTDTLEHTVHQLETTFHPHHYLIAQLKLVLVTKYSLVQGRCKIFSFLQIFLFCF